LATEGKERAREKKETLATPSGGGDLGIITVPGIGSRVNVQECGGGGDCLFRSLANQVPGEMIGAALREIPGEDPDAGQLRELLTVKKLSNALAAVAKPVETPHGRLWEWVSEDMLADALEEAVQGSKIPRMEVRLSSFEELQSLRRHVAAVENPALLIGKGAFSTLRKTLYFWGEAHKTNLAQLAAMDAPIPHDAQMAERDLEQDGKIEKFIGEMFQKMPPRMRARLAYGEWEACKNPNGVRDGDILDKYWRRMDALQSYITSLIGDAAHELGVAFQGEREGDEILDSYLRQTTRVDGIWGSQVDLKLAALCFDAPFFAMNPAHPGVGEEGPYQQRFELYTPWGAVLTGSALEGSCSKFGYEHPASIRPKGERPQKQPKDGASTQSKELWQAWLDYDDAVANHLANPRHEIEKWGEEDIQKWRDTWNYLQSLGKVSGEFPSAIVDGPIKFTCAEEGCGASITRTPIHYDAKALQGACQKIVEVLRPIGALNVDGIHWRSACVMESVPPPS
jgi:hypothetical protein